MNLAPLPTRALEMPVDRRLQSLMVIAGHQSHPAESARFEIAEQLVVRRRALRIGDSDREDLPVPVGSDTRDDEYALD